MTDTEEHIRAAACDFRDLAQAHLTETGRATSTNGLARMLGEDPPTFARYLKGTRVMTLDKLYTWVCRWRALGHPPMAIVATAAQVKVTR